MSRFFSRPISWFLVLASLALVARFHRTFVGPNVEWGDACTISLQIIEAKHFREIYANYSRWKIHHPGPALFYVMAWGEYLLHDRLHVVASEFAAQNLANTLLQFLFYVLAVSILVRRLAARWLAPVFFTLFWVHMYFAWNTQFDNWSVYMLLGPFFCLLVSSASVSMGEAGDWPVALLSAGFLAHSYLAMPAFVAPVVIATWLAYLKAPHDAVPEARRVRLRWLNGLIVAVFALPFAIDAAKGSQSNIVSVITFLRESRGERRTITHALDYFLSFLAYPDPEAKLEGGAFRDFFPARIPYLAGWAAIVAFDAAWFLRLRRDKSERYRYYARLLAYVAGALVFTLYWATRQYGEPFAFNAWFNFAILAFFLVPPAVELASGLERLPRPARVALVSAAAAAVCLLWTKDYIPPSGELPILAKVRSRTAQLSPESTVLLTFRDHDWPAAGCVALELKRRGVAFVVPEDWGIMFLSQTPRTAGPPTETWEILGNDAFAMKDPAGK